MVFRGSRYSDTYCWAEETWTAAENEMIVGLTQNEEKTRVTGIVTQPTTPPNAADCASEYCVKCPAGSYCTGDDAPRIQGCGASSLCEAAILASFQHTVRLPLKQHG